ncbi:MAG: hypothetical protein JSV85_02815 [Candidatus Bathyarchaeota archaeon]|nr:MAG: hypothetical protein JSV85_02815 [Candidatus Bathyarchaeota archaeon]
MSKEEYEDKRTKLAVEIEPTPSWLRRGETVTIVYGEFEEVEIEHKNKQTGDSYMTKEWMIGILLRDGSEAFRLVSPSVFADIVKAFEAESKDGKMPKTLVYQRPL